MLIALLTSIGFGTVSAIVPVVNAEAYVIASRRCRPSSGPIPHRYRRLRNQPNSGKLCYFSSAFARERSCPSSSIGGRFDRSAQSGPARARFRACIAKLLDLVGQERWGLPIVLVAAIVGFPPLYAVALLAGATTMRPIWFGLTVLVGRLCRFLWWRPASRAFMTGSSKTSPTHSA